MNKTLIIQNSVYARPGLILQYLNNKGFLFDVVSIDELKNYKNSFSHIISLGSERSILDNSSSITYQLNFLEQSLKKNKKVLGICFGAQLLSKIFGFKFISKGIKPEEIGLFEIEPTKQGLELGLYNLNSNKVLEAHNEGFIVPDDYLLSKSNLYDQSFLVDSNLGVQYHPEHNLNSIKEWVGKEGIYSGIEKKVTNVICSEEYKSHLNALMNFFYK